MKQLLFLFFLPFYSALPTQGFYKEIDKFFPKPSPTKTNRASSQEELNQRLLRACKEGNLQAIKQSLIAGADINTTTDYRIPEGIAKNVTPLTIAVLKKRNDIVDYLLRKKANIDHTYSIHFKEQGNLKNVTALFSSYDMGNRRRIFKKLLHAGANTNVILNGKVNGVEIKNVNLLGICFSAWDKGAIQSLILFEADVNVPVNIKSIIVEKENMYPIHYAVEKSNVKITRMILLSGSKVNVKANIFHESKGAIKQITPLMMAAIRGNVTLVRMLLLSGARLNDRIYGKMDGESIDGYTALDLARKNNRLEVVKLLEYAKKQQEILASDAQEK